MDKAIATIAKAIKQECKQLKPSNCTYNTRICPAGALEKCSPTRLSLLSELDSTLPAGLVGIIVTGTVTRGSTLLQGGWLSLRSAPPPPPPPGFFTEG